MPKTAFVSGKEILARVIRALGYKLPSTYHDDILEWIPEGLGMIGVTNTLVTESSGDINCPGEILVSNHCAQLPCGFQYLLAVEDETGRRLPEGGDVTDLRSQSSLRHVGVGSSAEPRVSVFEVNPYQHQTSDGLPVDEPSSSFPFLGQDLEQSAVTSRNTHYYKLQGNYIQTSFESGFIKIHYLALPVCQDGYPLIPDNENFKQALEWHVIRRLIGSGYEHKVFTYQQANEQFDIYAARGMGEVSYPSLDSMARLNRSLVRLIPPHQFHEDFFVNSEQPERLSK